MKKIIDLYNDFTDILNYKQQIRLLRKKVQELEKEPQRLIDKMNIMKIEIRKLKLQIKDLEREMQNENN